MYLIIIINSDLFYYVIKYYVIEKQIIENKNYIIL